MKKGFFAALKKTAAKLGACDPDWLKSEEELQFNTVEPGGSGPNMILLHGLFGALSNWETVTPHFQKYTNPIALQFPLLTAKKSEVKVKSLAVFTEYFLRSRNIDKTILCGNSLGGHVAMRLYLANPNLVSCMVLSATSGLYEHSVDTLPVRPDERFVREHMDRVFFHKQFITEDAVAEITKILASRANTLNLIHAARSAKKDNLLHELKHIKCPVLLLWGEDDLVTTMEVAEMFRKNIPNAKLVTVKGCGHAPMIEHPEWFAKEVEVFLKENGMIKA
mgnify:CR=1 FL=1